MAFADAREIFEVRWRVQYYIISFSDLSLSLPRYFASRLSVSSHCLVLLKWYDRKTPEIGRV